ncbi:MAG: phenylalanine--tRNA ligase beta subunit-related protein [Candidatus Bathyarchaeia archaeon]
MRIYIDKKVREDFPDLEILATLMENLKVRGEDPDLETLKANVFAEIKSKYNIESLKDTPSVRAYREFFWRIGIDPTKNRPAAEALIRRVLLGNPIPKINTFVDSLNIASMKSEVAIGSFDADKISKETIIMRYSNRGEVFHGIGMGKPIVLNGSEIILSDAIGPIAIYPHRDSERTKITEATRRAILIFCGVPGVDVDMLRRAMSITIELVSKFCGGSPKQLEVE